MKPWFDRHGVDLAQQSDPTEAQAALDELVARDEFVAFSAAQVRTLDLFLAHWVLTVLARTNDPDSVLALHRLCVDALGVLPQTPDFAETRGQWRGFAALLDGRHRVLEAVGNTAAPKLMQHDRVLELLQNGPLQQNELAQRLNLTPGRVSQLLSVMEQRGAVLRTTRGKAKFVSLPLVAVAVERAANEPSLGLTGTTYLGSLRQMFSSQPAPNFPQAA